MSMLAYLATPYTRFKYGEYNAVTIAAQIAGRLMQSGLYIFSPVTHGHHIAHYARIDPRDRRFWLDQHAAIMSRCDALIVAHMDGWDESVGIAHAVAYFERNGKPIFDLPDISTVNMRERSRAAETVGAARLRLAELNRLIADAGPGAALNAYDEERRGVLRYLGETGAISDHQRERV